MKLRTQFVLFACGVCASIALAVAPEAVESEAAEKPLHKFLPIEDKSNVSLAYI